MLQESKKYKVILIALFAIGGVLILMGYLFGDAASNKSSIQNDIKKMEENLEAFILNVEGIYQVDVIITMETYSEGSTVYTFYSNDEAITYSKVNGVCVACTGGNNDRIKKEVTDIVTSYLGIGSNKVKITGIKR